MKRIAIVILALAFFTSVLAIPIAEALDGAVGSPSGDPNCGNQVPQEPGEMELPDFNDATGAPDGDSYNAPEGDEGDWGPAISKFY